MKIAGLLSQKTSSDYICIINGVIEEEKALGTDISINFFDYQNDFSAAMKNAANIIKSKYDVVIGPRTTQEALGTLELFQKAQIPQILPVASHPDITKKSSNTIRMVASSDLYAKLISKFAMDNLKAKRIFIISNLSQPYSTFYRNAFPSYFEPKKDVNFKNFDFVDGFSEFDKLSEEIATHKPDLIYAPIYSVEITSLYSALSKKKDFKSRILTHAGMFEAKEILTNHFSPSIELIFNGIWDSKLRGPFAHKYEKIAKKYCMDTPTSVRTAAGFDAINIIITGHKKNKIARGDMLLKNIREQKFLGLLGNWKLDSNGDPLRDLHLYKLNKSGFKFLTSVEDHN